MAEDQKKPTMPEVNLAALDDVGEDQIDVTEAALEENPEIEAVHAELEELRAERDDFWDKYKRALAEAENARGLE